MTCIENSDFLYIFAKKHHDTMSHSVTGSYKRQKWYNKRIFPLVPTIQIRKADELNTSSFSFRWLFFTIWSLDSFDFEVSFVISTHWGFGFVGSLLYLRWVVAIPCPEKMAIYIGEMLHRKPKKK